MSKAEWQPPIQPLSYRAHKSGPPPLVWLVNETFGDRQFLGRARFRVFHEPADACLSPLLWSNGWAVQTPWRRAFRDGGVVRGMWDLLGLPGPVPGPPYRIFYSAIFAVTRDAILQWPRETYEKLLAFVTDEARYAEYGDRKLRSTLVEFLWHTLFAEPTADEGAVATCGEYDATLNPENQEYVMPVIAEDAAEGGTLPKRQRGEAADKEALLGDLPQPLASGPPPPTAAGALAPSSPL